MAGNVMHYLLCHAGARFRFPTFGCAHRHVHCTVGERVAVKRRQQREQNQRRDRTSRAGAAAGQHQ